MQFPRRRSDPTTAFWHWWADARAGIETALVTGAILEQVDEVTRRVRAIHPELEWEFGPGTTSTHVLCVTAAGRSNVRATAERWRLAGPPPDATWSYASARPPAPAKFDSVLQFGAVELPLEEVRFGTTPSESGAELDVVVHHPVFAVVDRDEAVRASFLVLDWALGEDDVERWIGTIDASDEAPWPLLRRDHLVEQVIELRAAHLDPQFTVAKATQDGRPILFVLQRPLKRVQYPLFDLHGHIELTYAGPDANNGMPEQDVNETLDELTDALEAGGGDDAVFAVRRTGAGVRAYDVFVDGEGEGRRRIDGVLAQRRWRSVKVTWTPDPAWSVLERYRVR